MKKKVLGTIIFILFTGFVVGQSTSPWYIDLTKQEVFVRVGFDIADTLENPKPEDKNWFLFPPAEEGGRLIRPVDVEHPDLPGRQLLMFTSHEEMEFTYAIPFDLELPRVAEVPGMHFAALGDNWEIYLNGHLIRQEMHLSEDGRILSHRARRDVFFPVDSTFFKDGSNLLAIRIVCDPTYPPGGMFQAKPYYIDTYENIGRENLEIFKIALLALYFFMGIYHIFLYFSRRQDKHNLFYGLFSTALFVYLSVRSHVIYYFIPDTHTIFRIEMLSLYALLPMVMAFLEFITESKTGKFTLFYGIFCAIISIPTLFGSINWGHIILRFWQITGLLVILYVFFYKMAWNYIYTALLPWRGQRNSQNPKSLFSMLLITLKDTAIGNMFIGGVVLVATAIYDIIDSLFWQRDLILTNYGFLVFTMGSAFIIANRFTFLYGQMNDLIRSLEVKIHDVETASEKVKISEKKYRSLFEGTSDAVVQLSKSFGVVEGNPAGLELLGTDEFSMKEHDFFSSLFRDKNAPNRSIELLRARLQKLLEVEEPLEVNLRFKGPMGNSRPVRGRFEPISSVSRGGEILFRAVPIQEDVLLQYFVGERLHYEIGNSLTVADEVSRRITSNLPRFIEKAEADFLMIGLREVIINAIEHGNLAINFDEKTEAQMSGKYVEFLMERQQKEEFRNKTVDIEFSISEEKVVYRITDQGPGFDHSNFLERQRENIHDVNDAMLQHGRGLSMALSIFDSIRYNEKGNQVTLLKKLA